MTKMMPTVDRKQRVYTYANVKSWAKNLNVFRMDKIFFPVHHADKQHWTMAVVFMQLKEIRYYDSLSGGNGRIYCDALVKWIRDEAVHRKHFEQLSSVNWKRIHSPRRVPRQENGIDCGVFAIMCADYLSDNLPLTYQHSDIHLHRRKIMASILRGSLNYPLPVIPSPFASASLSSASSSSPLTHTHHSSATSSASLLHAEDDNIEI
jgi:Ulp1 family protease